VKVLLRFDDLQASADNMTIGNFSAHLATKGLLQYYDQAMSQWNTWNETSRPSYEAMTIYCQQTLVRMLWQVPGMLAVSASFDMERGKPNVRMLWTATDLTGTERVWSLSFKFTTGEGFRRVALPANSGSLLEWRVAAHMNSSATPCLIAKSLDGDDAYAYRFLLEGNNEYLRDDCSTFTHWLTYSSSDNDTVWMTSIIPEGNNTVLMPSLQWNGSIISLPDAGDKAVIVRWKWSANTTSPQSLSAILYDGQRTWQAKSTNVPLQDQWATSVMTLLEDPDVLATNSSFSLSWTQNPASLINATLRIDYFLVTDFQFAFENSSNYRYGLQNLNDTYLWFYDASGAANDSFGLSLTKRPATLVVTGSIDETISSVSIGVSQRLGEYENATLVVAFNSLSYPQNSDANLNGIPDFLDSSMMDKDLGIFRAHESLAGTQYSITELSDRTRLTIQWQIPPLDFAVTPPMTVSLDSASVILSDGTASWTRTSPLCEVQTLSFESMGFVEYRTLSPPSRMIPDYVTFRPHPAVTIFAIAIGPLCFGFLWLLALALYVDLSGPWRTLSSAFRGGIRWIRSKASKSVRKETAH
jgi:hypothetical protein